MEHNPYTEAFMAALEQYPTAAGNPPSTPERPFWPTSHWVKPEPTLEDFKRLEEKVDRLLAVIERPERLAQLYREYVDPIPPGMRLPRSE